MSKNRSTFPQPLITSRHQQVNSGSFECITCWCCDRTPWTFAAYRPSDIIREMEKHLQQVHSEIFRVCMLTESKWHVSVDEISLFCGTVALPLHSAIELWGSWSDYDIGDFSDAADMTDEEWETGVYAMIEELKHRQRVETRTHE